MMKLNITALFIGIISFNSWAQKNMADTLPNTLSEVFITTKNNLPNIATARSADVLSNNYLKNIGSNTMYSQLNTASGVYMVDMGNEQHAMSIRLPMNYQPLYNYLENGIPIRPVGIFNNNELLELNRFSFNKIEIIKGPFSGGYGAQSIGAAVNFIQSNYTQANNELQLQSNGYGQWEVVNQLKANLGKWKLLTNYNLAQRNVDTILHFNYQKFAFSIRLENKINERNLLVFQSNLINYTGDQRDGYDSANFYNRNYTSFDKFSDRKTFALRNSLQWKHSISNRQKLNITVFNRVLNEKQNPFYLISYQNYTDTFGNGQITKDKFTSYGINIDHSYTNKSGSLILNQTIFLDYTPNNKYTSNYITVQRKNGVNLAYNNTDSLLTNYKADLKNIAAAASASYTINKLRMYAGLRVDLLTYNFTNYLPSNAYSGTPSGSNSFWGINPEVSLLYQLSNQQSFFAQWGSGFTPPTLSNMYRGVSTPQLTAARYYNLEFGYKLYHKNITLQLSLYNMNGVDEFVGVIRQNGMYDIINAGKTNHKGIELQLNYQCKNLSITFNPSYAQHTFKDYTNYGVKYDGNNMNSAPNYLHYANLCYTFKQFHGLKLIAEWNKVGSYYINASNTKKYEGYDLLNLKATMVLHSFMLNVGVNNLLDKIYATNADGTYGVRYYPGLPRTLQVGVSYKW